MDIREFISEQTTKKNRTNKNPPPSFYSVGPFSHIIFQNGLRSFSQSSFCARGFSSRTHTLQLFERFLKDAVGLTLLHPHAYYYVLAVDCRHFRIPSTIYHHCLKKQLKW